MGKSGRYHRDQTRRGRNDERSDSMNPDHDAYDDVMDIYADQSDLSSENYGYLEEDEDDL